MALKIGTVSVSNIVVKRLSVSSTVNLVYVKQGNTTTTVFVKQPTINSAKCWIDSSGSLLYSATVTVKNPCDKALTCYILAYDSLGVVRDTVSFSINAKTTISHDIGLSSTDGDGSAVSWGNSSVVAYLEDTNGCESLRTESNFTYEEKVYGKLLKPTNVSVSWKDGDRNGYFVDMTITNPNNVDVTANWNSGGAQKTGTFDVRANSTTSYTIIIAETDQDRGNLDGDVYFSASGYADSDIVIFN